MQAADRDQEASGSVRSEGDLFLKGAQGHQRNPEVVFHAESYYPTWTLVRADEALKKKIPSIAGWQNILRPPDVHPRHASS